MPVTPLDPNKCQPGTKGYLPQPSIFDYEGWGEGESIFDAFKEPSVTLNENHQWVGANGVPPDEDVECVVFATWQDAVRYTIEQDRQTSEDIIRSVLDDIKQAAKVEAWLELAEKSTK